MQRASFSILAWVKRDHVVADELDNGIRSVSQFWSHPSGMPLKRQLVMGRLRAWRSCQSWVWCSSLRVAEEKGLMPKANQPKIEEMCQKFGLPVTYENWDKEAFIASLTHDKKRVGRTLKLVIVPELGQAAIHQIPLQEMKDSFEKERNKVMEIFNSRRVPWAPTNSHHRGGSGRPSLSEEDINKELKRRQGGYGRGARMKIESDRVEITSGVRHGLTMGGPITLNVTNLDHQNGWRS